MTSDQFPAFRTKVVVVVEILKNTEMQFLCTRLYIQQWWDVYPTVTYFWPHCPCPSVSFTLKMGYIADPAHIAQPEICWLNSLFPLMHGVSSNQCILCNVCVARQEQWYWQNEALEQGQLLNSLYLFNCIKVIGKACVFETFQLKHSWQKDRKTNKPAIQLILIDMRGEYPLLICRKHP